MPPRGVTSLDQLVLPTSDWTVRAILFPVSAAAIHSAHLPANARNSVQVAQAKFLPSPYNSDDDEDGGPEKKNQGSPHQVGVLLLKQSLDNEKFTLGSSPENDVLLEHPTTATKGCYINLVHLKLYPDPDSGGLELCNKSKSIFTVQSLTITKLDKIGKDQVLLLGCGDWVLSISEGLDF